MEEKRIRKRESMKTCRSSASGVPDKTFSGAERMGPKYPHLDLDFQPQLTWKESFIVRAASLISAFAMGAMIFVFRGRGRSITGTVGTILSISTELLVCLLTYLATKAITTNGFMEHHHAKQMLSPESLSDPDSLFKTVGGLKIHYKRSLDASVTSPDKVLCCLHGFGANTFSWEAVQRELSCKSNGIVLAMDMPGFGLTERPKALRSYSSSVGGQLALGLVQSEKEEGLLPSKAKTVLVGHSLGCASVASATCYSPENVDGIVLVNPAIVATGDAGRNRFKPLAKFFLVLQLVTGTLMNMIAALITPLVLPFLRNLVRNKTFWQRGLQSAWAKPELVSEDTIDGYRRSKLAKGWDKGLWKFVRAKLLPPGNLNGGVVEGQSPQQGRWQFWKALQEYISASLRSQRSQAEELARIVEEHKIPVLIIHGREDKLVPASNSLRLSQMIQGSQYVELHPCGHVPHEELPVQFSNAVAEFIENCIAK